MKKTIAYRLGNSGKMDAKQVIESTLFHSQNPENGGRVLFTTGSGPQSAFWDDINEIILMTADGQTAIIGHVKAIGKMSTIDMRPAGYDQPSQWPLKDRPEEGYWFAIDSPKKITIQRGDYTALSNGKDLLEAHSPNGPFIYVERNE